MSKVLIIINAEVKEGGKYFATSPVTEKMLKSLKKAIAGSSPKFETEIVAASLLWSASSPWHYYHPEWLYCPLTIQLPDNFVFPQQETYGICKDIQGLQKWVKKQLGFSTSDQKQILGNLWLPVILTEKGPVYGELIGEGAIPNSYQQPIDAPDNYRQSLYYLAFELLQHIQAQPATYLLQFAWQNKTIIFDRIWPFSAAPALASVGVQKPDLFTCHWYCLTKQPILDLTIMGVNPVR
jgi:hypothetical protein